MLEAEAHLRKQINCDEECSFAAGQILKMRIVMAGLIRQRADLGDAEPILVESSTFEPSNPRPLPAPAGVAARPRKRRLQAPPKRRVQRVY